MTTIYRYYYKYGITERSKDAVFAGIEDCMPGLNFELDSEVCFYVADKKGPTLTKDAEQKLMWILSESCRRGGLKKETWLQKPSSESSFIVEVGPRLNFSTPWSTNAVSVCKSIGLDSICRIEQSRRYLFTVIWDARDRIRNIKDIQEGMPDLLYDRMTETVYEVPLESFDLEVHPASVYEVDVLTQGQKALEKVNKDLGLSFDSWDIEFYTKLFKEQLQRNPTSVECFDLAQSNSEHSRHWFFKGNMVFDKEGMMSESLMKMVMSTQEKSNDNNVIKFSDNSSAISGFEIDVMRPNDPTKASNFSITQNKKRHITFTAETHNFPTGVAPFPGATTGTGGRIRDNHAAGCGAHIIAGTAGYCFGNLYLPDYDLPWEDDFIYPCNFAPPSEVAVEASNGASDYGNKFGEPVISGFARSFGFQSHNGERKEWIKPIMFSGGLGAIEDEHIRKKIPEKGMKVLKIGGPVYRIGVGGGAASSVQIQGDNEEALDFGAVQRGDAEMEQKLNRVIRACIELGEKNPICSIHDQGAGGNGNVLKEIVDPAGAVIYAKEFELGDPTISTLELWGAEYQENDAVLIQEKDCDLMKKLGKREKVPVCIVGTVTGDGRIVLDESGHINSDCQNGDMDPKRKKEKLTHPVDLPLEVVLGKMPTKTFHLEEVEDELKPIVIPGSLTLKEALDRVLRLPSVGSKRYLTNKVDRCVSGLIAQQQCVGPLHTPLADVAVVALSHFNTVGAATAIGEQPIKGLVDPGCGARMSLGEALSNLVFAKISTLKDVKCSGNWMWPAKIKGEGARMYRACRALTDAMKELGVAIDGGKDSLSMAARVEKDVVKSPGAIVVSAYAPCPDITKTVTPDLKCPAGKGVLLWVDISGGRARLGGTAFAHVFKQIGDESPDMDDTQVFSKAFTVTQSLIEKGMLVSGHDISDGGVLTTALEMAFAGNCGLQLNFNFPTETQDMSKIIQYLFAEELGFILEVSQEHENDVLQAYKNAGVLCHHVGFSVATDEDPKIVVLHKGDILLQDSMVELRYIWEATSFRLERLQANPVCVAEEESGLKYRQKPAYKLTYVPKAPQHVRSQCEGPLNVHQPRNETRPKVAVIREEGSNGDREMVASLIMANFDVWDVTMQDLCNGSITLEDFRGVVFVGGFSYADVFGSAKGWAAVSRFNELANKELENFRHRKDTFSLGVCNGCQLMGLLGWVGVDKEGTQSHPVDGAMADINEPGSVCFTHNTSGRFECRFVTVKINKTASIMLNGMEDSVLGIWVAHGEGRAQFLSDKLQRNAASQGLIALQYVDDNGIATEKYPLNPNGSPSGIAALCSQDGRHLAMMPHPERTTLTWQWPWMPAEWRGSLEASPWLQMFHNAYTWCKSSNSSTGMANVAEE